MRASSALLSTPAQADGGAIPGGGAGGLSALPEGGTTYEPPRVVSEDAKFLTLDSRQKFSKVSA
jgi:hypothetical protein